MRSMIPTRSARIPGGLQATALLGLAGLAASLLYVHSRQRQVERAHPPHGKFIDVDGVRLHYVERGQGPALILLHGNSLLPNDFDLSGMLDSAPQPHRIIAFDRPGFGYSERPGNRAWTPEAQARLFYRALHQMGVKQPIVVGHAWGVLVALSMALDFPRYVRAIALVSGYYYPGTRRAAPLLSAPPIPGLGPLLRHTVAPLVARLLWPRLVKRLFAPGPVPDRFQELPKWMALRPSQLGASAAENAMTLAATRRLSARYGGLTLPIAVIAGEGDEIVDIDQHTLRFHREVRHSELIIEDDGGHMAHYADPVRIMAAVTRLEASLTPGGANLRHAATVHASATTMH